MYEFKNDHIPREAWDQDEVWYDRRGDCYTIANMNQTHARNVLAWIWKRYGKTLQSARHYCNKPLVKALEARSMAPPSEEWSARQRARFEAEDFVLDI